MSMRVSASLSSIPFCLSVVGVLLWATFLLSGCASQGMPTGGPKDETPPKLLRTFPNDQSTNFNGQTIILEFDEDIKADQLNNQLQISPSTDITYKSVIKRNRLTLTFNEPFEENTTYTLSFGDGVVDFNEGNKPKNIKLAFSTGDAIDSLFIVGKVKELLTDQPLENVLVGLVRASDSLDIDKKKPLYFSLTDSSGNYAIENIRPDEYKVYALAEASDKRNFVYDKSEEMIGFYEEPMNISTSYKNVDFEVVRYDIDSLRLMSARSRLQYYEIKFNKTLAEYDIKYRDEKYDTLFFPIQQEEYLTFYNLNFNTDDSVVADMMFRDSVGIAIDTTLTIKFAETRKPRESEFSAREVPASNNSFAPNTDFDMKFIFSKPVWQVQYDSIIYGYKGDSTGNRTTESDWKFNENRTELSFVRDIYLEDDTVFQIQVREHAFISVENDSLSEAKNLDYKRAKPKDYGVISGNIIGGSDNFIIEVIDEKGKVEQRIKNERSYRFENLNKGIKTMRVLIDSNGNGEWDRGSFKLGIPPEPVLHLGKEIEVKPNWEFEDTDFDLSRID